MPNNEEFPKKDKQLGNERTISNTDEHFLLNEFKTWMLTSLFSLAALGTVFPLIANRLNQTVGISLGCAYRIVCTIYFIIPIVFMSTWVYLYTKKYENQKYDSDYRSLQEYSRIVFVNFLILATAGLIWYWFDIPFIVYIIILGFGLIFLIANHFNLYRLKIASFSHSKNKKIFFYTSFLISIIIFITCCSIFNHSQKEYSNTKLNGIYNFYTGLENYQEQWREIEKKIDYINFSFSLSTFDSENIKLGDAEKKDFLDSVEKLNNITNNTKTLLAPKSKPFIEWKKEYSKTFTNIKDEISKIKTKSDSVQRRKLADTLNGIFHSGLLLFALSLIVLLNFFLFFKIMQSSSMKKESNSKVTTTENSKKPFTKEVNIVRAFIVIIIILVIPIFRTVNEKDVKLEDSIWPINLEYMITGGNRFYGPSKYTKKNQNIEINTYSSDINEILWILKKIYSGELRVYSIVESNAEEINTAKDNIFKVISQLEAIKIDVKNTLDEAMKISDTTKEVKNK